MKTIEYKGQKFEVVENATNDCNGCYFSDKTCSGIPELKCGKKIFKLIEPKEGDMVLVRDSGTEWAERIYLGKFKDVYVCVAGECKEYEYKNTKFFDTTAWRQMKPIEQKKTINIEGKEFTTEQLIELINNAK